MAAAAAPQQQPRQLQWQEWPRLRQLQQWRGSRSNVSDDGKQVQRRWQPQLQHWRRQRKH
jgi:hypothetical protein